MRFQMINDQIEAQEFESFEAAVAAGFKPTGQKSKNWAEAAARGAAVPRPMLWDQPEFEGMCGPMFGKSYETGEECLRYEDWKANDILSR